MATHLQSHHSEPWLFIRHTFLTLWFFYCQMCRSAKITIFKRNVLSQWHFVLIMKNRLCNVHFVSVRTSWNSCYCQQTELMANFLLCSTLTSWTELGPFLLWWMWQQWLVTVNVTHWLMHVSKRTSGTNDRRWKAVFVLFNTSVIQLWINFKTKCESSTQVKSQVNTLITIQYFCATELHLI